MNDIQMASKKLELLNKRDLIVVTHLIDTLLEVEEIQNAETLEAMAEVEDMEKHPELYKGYTDIDEMFEEILS